MNNETKRGRPRLGNVLFARRVPEGLVAELLQVIMKNKEVFKKHEGDTAGDVGLSAPVVKTVAEARKVVGIPEYGSMANPFDAEVMGLRKEGERLRSQIKALLDDAERNQETICSLRLQVEKALEVGDDVKVGYWRKRALDAEAAWARCRNGE